MTNEERSRVFLTKLLGFNPQFLEPYEGDVMALSMLLDEVRKETIEQCAKQLDDTDLGAVWKAYFAEQRGDAKEAFKYEHVAKVVRICADRLRKMRTP